MLAMTCPSQDDLLAFHLGTLGETELDLVGDHLETCLECQSRVQILDHVSDPLLAVLRSAESSAGARPTSASFVAEEILEFLAPAVDANELGRLGPYSIRRLLGRGGMGVVFAAEDTRLGRLVALKVLTPHVAAQPEARQRFLREARAMASVGANPHLVPIYDVGEANGLPFLSMELLEGQPLNCRLAEGTPMNSAEIIRLGRGIAAGLAVAHARGLVHRDIKPANLWVQSPGDTVKVLDFGLARAATEEVRVTSSGIIPGTPAYLSPEQASDEPLDHRSDLFSFGCVLYELCAGHPPFKGRTAIALLAAVSTVEPVSLRKLRPDLPTPLVALIHQLLAKRPADRPATAQVVVDRLDEIRQASGTRAQRTRERTNLKQIGSLLVIVATLLVAAVVFVRTSKGLVEIRSDDPNVKVMVEQDGELVTILDPVSKQQVELRAGEYHVKLDGATTGFKLNTDHFTLSRGGQKVVTVRRLDDIPKSVDEGWLARVTKLEADAQIKEVIDRLRQLNPEFKDEVQQKIESGVVREIHFCADRVQDISPVRALTGLRGIGCYGANANANTRRFSDLSPLRGLKLTRLDCSTTGVSDLTPLEGMPLEELSCANTLVSDLTALRGMPLKSLSCDGARISSLAALEGLPLTWLNCGRNESITDLAPLRGMKLIGLMCEITKIKDLSPLRGLPLNRLNLGVTPVTDLTPLKDMPLTFLGIGQCPVADLTPLQGMKLESLWANHTEVSDISPLRGMPLETLWLGSAKVANIAPLADMPKLKDVGVDVELVKDLGPLWGISTLEIINGQPAKEFRRKHGPKSKD